MVMLEIKDLYVSYGMIEAIKGISFKIQEGEIVSLIGANGAGKTTIMHTVSGLLKPKRGQIHFNDISLLKISADKIVQHGLSQVPERRRVFAKMSVEDNLLLGAYTRKDVAKIKEDLNWVYGYFPRLKDRSKQLAGTLSGGEQQMLAMARALMSRPKLLLLDEPSMGLAPLLIKEIFHIIEEINRSGTTILLVEQNAKMALKISNRAYVLENGRIVYSGSGHELMNSDEIKKAYLGG
ncbi:ABC transporter ATP-binding protein [Erysipelotrichaceae bacterium OH741_COT-311]|nr:ABC transporter ATP-binding protein [Erysipelotrichaceae bacterium OH741_COT-311]